MTSLPDTAESPTDLVRAAAQGDPHAIERLMLRYARVVWATVRAFRLREADAKDAVQNTWLRMLEHLGAIRDPERLGAWLVTTARRECLKMIRQGQRETPGAESFLSSRPDDRTPTPERHTVGRSMNQLLWQHIAALPGPGRDLLVELSGPDAPAYAEYAHAKGIPVGSIGPTRMRYLRKLRQRLEASGLGVDAWR